MTRAWNFKDLTGQTFGRLTVLSLDPASHSKKTLWSCQCECGNIKSVLGTMLRNGHTSSCGCFQIDFSRQRHTTHGMSGSPEFQIWAAMWARCTNPNHVGYSKYKDRTPPEEWRDFVNFYAELGPRPTPSHTLERTDNTKPYGPGNCTWATRKTQNRNTSCTIRVILDGNVVSLSDACEATGLKHQNTRARFARWGDMLRASNGLFTLHTQGVLS